MSIAVIFNQCTANIFKTCNTRLSNWGTDLFPLGCLIKRQRPTQQQLSGVNESKAYLFFLSEWQKSILFGVPQNFSHSFNVCQDMTQGKKHGSLSRRLLCRKNKQSDAMHVSE